MRTDLMKPAVTEGTCPPALTIHAVGTAVAANGFTLDGDPSRCPLCGKPNDCQLCTTAAGNGRCWCQMAESPGQLHARVASAVRGRVCLCRDCLTTCRRDQREEERLSLKPDDFYHDAAGVIVFTATYHLRRGYCCGHACRHCPYPEPTK